MDAHKPKPEAPWDFQDPEESRRWIAQYGEKPMTRELPTNYETAQDAFIVPDYRTPAGGRYGRTDARRGGRLLGIIASILCALGAAGEILAMLVAVSGAEQARLIQWPLASAPSAWRGCEFLPNSDAPATKYGAGLVIFFHAINVVIFAGTFSFLVRFSREPRADYGIGASGLIMITLGLGLASRWLGSLQMLTGTFLSIFGIFNVIFGRRYLFDAFKTAFKPLEPISIEMDNAEEQAKARYDRARAKIESDKRKNIYRGSADLIVKQLQAYHRYTHAAKAVEDAEKK